MKKRILAIVVATAVCVEFAIVAPRFGGFPMVLCEEKEQLNIINKENRIKIKGKAGRVFKVNTKGKSFHRKMG